MKRLFRRSLSGFFAFLMLFNSVDISALASENNDELQIEEAADEIVCEDSGDEVTELEAGVLSDVEVIDCTEAVESASEDEISVDELDSDYIEEYLEGNLESDDLENIDSDDENIALSEDVSVSDNGATVPLEDILTFGENTVSDNDLSISVNSVSENVISVSENTVSENAVSENEIDIDENTRVYNGDGFVVTYTVTSTWENGYNATIEIENTSFETIHDWMVAYDCDDEYSNIWNGQIFSHEAGRYEIKNAVWNQDIASGKSVTFGFTGKTAFGGFPSEYELIGTENPVNKDDYTIWYEVNNDWGSGFQGTIYIKNNACLTIEDWTLDFDFDRKITTIWNAEIVESQGKHYSIRNLSYNANIGAGEVVAIGFLGTNGTKEDEPYNYKLYSYVFDEMEYIQLEDGKIEKDYILHAILPNLAYSHENIDDIRLADDFDNDGLNLYEEYQYDTNPFAKDTDEDGLNDYEEIYVTETNPIMYDTDGDGLGDGTEIDCGLNPCKEDTDDNGVKDGDETTTQNVRLYSVYNYNLGEEGTKPSLSVTGKGDYSQQIYVEKEENNKSLYDLDYVVGSAYDFVHGDNLTFDDATITYALSDELLRQYSIEDLVIAYYNEETGELELLETSANVEAGTISAGVNHLSTYVVISSSKFFGTINVVNYGANIENVPVDIVFAIDITVSMRTSIKNVQDNVSNFTSSLEFNNIDARYGLITYKDIYDDGMASTVNHGWYTDSEAFGEEVGTLRAIDAGGDAPESTTDAIYRALRMNYRAGASKYVVAITDAENKNGIVGNSDVTLGDVMIPFSNDYASVSVVTYPRYYSEYSGITSITNGALMDISSDFSVNLEALVAKISNDISDKYWIRLSNGKIVALDANPLFRDTSVDTDGDGLADIFELGEIVTIKAYNPVTKAYIEYEAWSFISDPTEVDTDGDTVCDTIDLYPKAYDYVIESEDEDTILFNSGRVWHKTDCTANAYLTDDCINHYGLAYAGNTMALLIDDLAGEIAHDLAVEADGEAVELNKRQDFVVEELAYIGLANNEGSKLYMHEKTGRLREQVFEFICNRESEYFRHKGYIWGEGWEKIEPGDDRTSGFWKGLVLSEADLNFSCKMYTEKDATELYTALKQVGAVLICVVIVYSAAYVIVSAGSVGLLASNAGMASTKLVATTAAGSIIVAIESPTIVGGINRYNQSLAELKFNSIVNISDAEKAAFMTNIEAMLASNEGEDTDADSDSAIADGGSVSGNNTNNDSDGDDDESNDSEGGNGSKIDTTPSQNHTTVEKNPGPKGTPNSSVDILDKQGNVVTRRWYDSNGNAIRDVDMTDHGNPKMHPEVPHEHIWDWSGGRPIRGK